MQQLAQAFDLNIPDRTMGLLPPLVLHAVKPQLTD